MVDNAPEAGVCSRDVHTRGSWVGLLATAALFAVPGTAHATTVSFESGSITILTGANGADLDISAPVPGTVRVVESSVDDDLGASLNCTEPIPETVECTGVGTSPTLYYFGGPAGDSVNVDPGVSFRVELYGRGGPDVLLGGSGDDRLGGGTGADDLDGRGGSDLVENGYDDSAHRPPTTGRTSTATPVRPVPTR